MSIFKCKMCGGTLEINNNETVGVCEYCGTKQTLPKLDDDKKINLYDMEIIFITKVNKNESDHIQQLLKDNGVILD